MKYMAIIEADEKPVSCEFIGCNGNVAPYLIGATNNIKVLEQEPVIDKIRAEIWDLQYGDEEKSMTDENRADAYNNAIRQVIEIIDKYKDKAESEG